MFLKPSVMYKVTDTSTVKPFNLAAT